MRTVGVLDTLNACRDIDEASRRLTSAHERAKRASIARHGLMDEHARVKFAAAIDRLGGAIDELCGLSDELTMLVASRD